MSPSDWESCTGQPVEGPIPSTQMTFDSQIRSVRHARTGQSLLWKEVRPLYGR
jgi:hypothetical protein